ncbi:MAG: DDE-type integrase/transposase/recombinase [Bacillota bacterium]
MDRRKAQEIANFRYGLIAPVVSRQDLDRGEQARLLGEVASSRHRIPYSTRTQVSVRTLERYLEAYRARGWEGLLPSPRTSSPRLPGEVLDWAVRLREENPQRSIDRIIRVLEDEGTVEPGRLKRSTLYDHFTRLGLTRSQMPRKESYQRYQARRRNQRWQGDVHHLLYLPQPDGTKRKVFLVAFIDDYSRFVPHAEIYRAERLPMLEDSLKKALTKHGVPEQIHVDNGAIYSAHHFERILGHLGIQLIHSRPYRPAGRGKVERFFQLVCTSFTSEAYRLLEKHPLTLEELNDLFWAWLQAYYHERIHSATKEKPALRFEHDPTPLRRVDLAGLHDAFLMEEYRKVDKTGVFTIDQIPYQAPLELAHRRVLVRYDPYDPQVVQVHWDGRQDDATMLVVPEHAGKKKPEPVCTPTDSGLNFLTALEHEHKARLDSARLSYRGVQGGKPK